MTHLRLVTEDEPEEESWQDYANCIDKDPDLFFPGPGDNSATLIAKRICAECEVRDVCLEFALWSGEKHGVWGGVTERERRKIRRDRRLAGNPTGGRESYRNWDFFAELIHK